MNEGAWTEFLVAELRRMHELGYSAAEISRALGSVSRSAVIGKIHRLGIQKGRLTRNATRYWAARLRDLRPSRPPAPFEPARIDVESPEPLGLLDLPDEGRCRWPVHEEGAPFLYCANACPTRRSYCDGHHAAAYDSAKTKALRERQAGLERAWIAGRLDRPGRRRPIGPK